MSRLDSKKTQSNRRQLRVRARTVGTAERPRLSVYISNKHVSAQIIDDTTSSTIASSTTVGNKAASGTMTQQAQIIGKDIAAKAKKAKVTKVVLDRGSKLYHGRIKALADAARQEGLEF